MWNPRDEFGPTSCQSSSSAEVLSAAGLAGWNPRLTATYAVVDGENVELPSTRAVIATTPAGVRVVGESVSPKYHPTPNEVLLPYMDQLIEEFGVDTWVAGSYSDGAVVFVQGFLPYVHPVGGLEVQDTVTLMTSHDGSLPTSVLIEPLCAHRAMVNIDLLKSPHSAAFRHTGGARDRIDRELEQFHEHVYSYLDRWSETSEQLAGTTVTNRELDDMLTRIYPEPRGGASATRTRWEAKLEIIAQESARVADNPRNITLLDALVGGATWFDRYYPARGARRGYNRAVRSVQDVRGKSELAAKLLEYTR